MVALAGKRCALHLPEQCVHFTYGKRPACAHAAMAGHGAAPIVRAFFQRQRFAGAIYPQTRLQSALSHPPLPAWPGFPLPKRHPARARTSSESPNLAALPAAQASIPSAQRPSVTTSGISNFCRATAAPAVAAFHGASKVRRSWAACWSTNISESGVSDTI